MAYKTVRFKDFSGGMNSYHQKYGIEENEAQSISNISVNRRLLAVRDGQTVHNDTNKGSSAVDGMHRGFIGATGYFLTSDRDSGGRIIKWDITAGSGVDWTKVVLKTGLTGSRLVCVDLQDSIFMSVSNDSGGTDNEAFRYDGTNVRKWGVAAPAAIGTPGEASATGGLSAGVYQFQYTYVTEDGAESDPSPAASITISGTNVSAAFRVTASADAQVASINVYRTTIDGATFLKEQTGVANTTACIASGLVADAALGAAVSNRHDPPPVGGFSMMMEHENRIWAAGDNDNLETLYISALEGPWYFPTTNDLITDGLQHNIKRGGGHSITGLGVAGNVPVVFTRSSMTFVTGSNADQYSFETLEGFGGTGCISHETIAQVAGNLVWYDGNGIWTWAGSEPLLLSEKIQDELDAIPVARRAEATATFDGRFYRFFYAPAGSSTNTEALYLDIGPWTAAMPPSELRKRPWMHRTATTARSSIVWDRDDGQVYIGSSANGQVILQDTGTRDGMLATEADISYEWVSPRISFGGVARVRRGRIIGITSPQQTVNVRIDIGTNHSSQAITNLSTTADDPNVGAFTFPQSLVGTWMEVKVSGAKSSGTIEFNSIEIDISPVRSSALQV